MYRKSFYIFKGKFIIILYKRWVYSFMKGNTGFQVSLAKIAKELQMELIYTPADANDIYIKSPNVIRPGIELT